MKLLNLLMALLTMTITHAQANTCSATSGAQRVALLELYTSEGCDSCPPTDRWVSALATRGFAGDRVIPLAFHVDYWNYLGWKDPFAQARHTERQRFVNARVRTRTIYTPQLMLDGKDYRRGLSVEAFTSDIAAINRLKPGAAIELKLASVSGALDVSATITAPASAQVYFALTENRLSNQVTAGENRGHRLEHDYVVRELAGPFATAGARHRFSVNPNWKTRDLTTVAFVQDAASGEVLQALALPYCG